MQIDVSNCFCMSMDINTMELSFTRLIDHRVYTFKHTSTDHSTLLRVLETVSSVTDEHFKIIATISRDHNGN